GEVQEEEMKRFYKDVAVVSSPASGTAHGITLDGKPVKTPGQSLLSVPSHALAEAVAGEWRGQGETVSPETMPLTKLVNTAIDRVPANRQAIVEQIVGYGRTDLLCYRADSPAGLVVRQNAAWNPWLVWLADAHGARLSKSHGIGF